MDFEQFPNDSDILDEELEATLANAKVASSLKKSLRDNLIGIDSIIDYRRIAKTYNRLSRGKSAHRSLSERTSFRRKDINYVRSVFNDVKDAMKHSEDELFDYSMDVTGDNLYSRIFDSKNVLLNSDAFVSKMFGDESQLKIKDYLHNKYTGDSKRRALAINSIVDILSGYSNDEVTYFREGSDIITKDERFSEIITKVKLELDEVKSIIKDYKVLQNKTKKHYGDFVKSKRGIAEFISDKVLDYEDIANKLGYIKEDEVSSFVTVKDILENKDKFKDKAIKNLSSESNLDLIKEMESLVEKDKRFSNIIVDRNLRKDLKTGDIINIKPLRDSLKEAKEGLKDNNLAKVFKVNEMLKDDQKNFIVFNKGTYDRVLSSVDGDEKSRLRSNYIYINDKFYKQVKDEFVHVKELDDYKVIKSSSAKGRLLKDLMGDNHTKQKLGRGPLDIGTKHYRNQFQTATDFINKANDPLFKGNIISDILGSKANLYKMSKEGLSADDYKYERQKLIALNEIFNNSITSVFDNTIKELTKRSPESLKHITEMLTMSPEDALNQLAGKDKKNFHNRNLASIVNSYIKDQKGFLGRSERRSDNLAVMGSESKMSQGEIVQVELIKEFFLRANKEKQTSNHMFEEIIDKLNVSEMQKRNLNRIAAWSLYQDKTGVGKNKKILEEEDNLKYALRSLGRMIHKKKDDGSKERFQDEFINVLKDIKKQQYNVLSKGDSKLDRSNINYGEYSVVSKSVNILDALNDETKMQSFMKQFTAGAKNPNDVSSLTLGIYGFFSKINKSLDPIGLSLSSRDMTSPTDFIAGMVFKRFLPAAVAFKGLSYLDYEAGKLFGVSFRGAAANTAANLDIGMRTILDKTGMTSELKALREANPIARYIFGKKRMSADERRKWYSEGYSPVRSGRYWSFMSTNEFRGGKIDYFQPNWFRRAHSNARDISIYGSSDEKWKYSWLPTPRHPFAPITRLLDPYRLERRNYMDRPYHYTGDMFGHSFPGSGILNATVGQILKPGMAMHTNRTGGGYADSRDELDRANREIREEANKNLMQIDKDGRISSVSYTPFKPYGTRDVNIKIRDGKVSISTKDYNERPGVDIDEFEDAYHEVLDTKEELINDHITTRSGKLRARSIYTEMFLGDLGNPFADIKRQYMKQRSYSTNEINWRNKQIIENAEKAEQGVITKDRILDTRASSSVSYLTDPQVLTDLRNVRTSDNYLRDTLYQGRKLAGMQGYVLGKMFPSKRRYTKADASSMESASRAYWDMGLGGLGGVFTQPFRRFLPHDDHSTKRISTIRNTMPEWMPDRFKYGDPYAMLPKGEMRLPGRGYESMNELNPDQYGEMYGAFDRMKILADIAPWSPEYKMWRDIAQKTVRDPYLREQMDDIKDRVEEQSKRHDFYHYRFKGQKVDTREAVIKDIFDGNKFTVVGDDTVYRLGKIDTLLEGSEEIIRPGMFIKMQTGRDDKDSEDERAATVFHEGQNINRRLLQSDLAIEGKTKTVIDARANLSGRHIVLGNIFERIAHADIPIIHKKFLRINDPLESYKQERVYGNNHENWDNLIQGRILPAFREASSVGPIRHALGLATWYLSEFLTDENTVAPGIYKKASVLGFSMVNKGALVGTVAASVINMGFDPEKSMKFARAGAMAQMVGYTIANRGSMTKSVAGLSTAGAILGHQLFSTHSDTAGLDGAKVGALAGVLLSSFNKSALSKTDSSYYIPDNLRKRWDLEEYMDRLKYVKYSGLYEKAARKAEQIEGVDIKAILERADKEREENEKIREELLNSREKISNIYSESDPRGRELLANIDHKLGLLNSPEGVIRGGYYTKAALAYKEARDSTIYGLKEDATWAEIMRALPKEERDYMLEFAKETDEKKRKEMYNLVSPYQRKVLDIAWGNKVKKQKSNWSYFLGKEIPNGFWAGWNADADMDKIKLKTIKNEGMLISDFGYNESDLQDPEYQASPELRRERRSTPLQSAFRLISAMNGYGFKVGDVSLSPKSTPGISAVFNVARERSNELKREVATKLGLAAY